MTNQSQPEAPGHAEAPFWRRISPFLDVIGAVLIFGSWILSNSLSQRAQEQAKTHEAIIGRVRGFRLYDDFAQRIVEIQSDLTRTRNLVEHAVPTQVDAESAADLTWTGMTATQIREIYDLVRDLDEYAGRLSGGETESQSIATAKDRAESLSKAFHVARSEFDQLAAERDSLTPAADVAAMERREEQIRKQVDRLWQHYGAAKQGMLHVGDNLLRTAAAESESASHVAKQCTQLSYVLYVIGTLIILLGRVKSTLGAKATPEKNEQASSS